MAIEVADQALYSSIAVHDRRRDRLLAERRDRRDSE